MYAIIETGGKQYRVQTGDVIYVEKLNAEADEEITFDKVVAVCNKTLKVTSRRRAAPAKWVTDSPIPRYRSAKSADYD